MLTDEFIASESYESSQERRWLWWAEQVERALGHDLDGDQEIDGYSIDFAFERFKDRLTVAQYVAEVRETKRWIDALHWHDEYGLFQD